MQASVKGPRHAARAIGSRGIENRSVGGLTESLVEELRRVVTGGVAIGGGASRRAEISRGTGEWHFAFGHSGRVLEQGEDVLAFEIWVVGEDLIDGVSGGEVSDRCAHGDAHAADAGERADPLGSTLMRSNEGTATTAVPCLPRAAMRELGVVA